MIGCGRLHVMLVQQALFCEDRAHLCYDTLLVTATRFTENTNCNMREIHTRKQS